MDLSPNYAGSLMALINTTANMTGFLTPYVASTITSGNVSGLFSTDQIADLTNLVNWFQQTFAAWRTVFLIASGLYVCAVAQFLFFADVSVQPWNTYWEPKMKKEEPQVITD